MIPDEAWHAFAGVAAIVILLGGVALALQRLGIIGRAAPAPAPAPEAEDLTDLKTRVSVLEERTKQQQTSIEGIGKLHARIDDVSTCISRVEGEVQGMRRTLDVMLRHLMSGDDSP